MNAKALYNGRWYSVANIRFDVGFVSLNNDGANTLGLALGNTLSVSFNSISDLKINGISVWE